MEAYKVELYDTTNHITLIDKQNFTDTTINNIYNIQTKANLQQSVYCLRVYDKSYYLFDAANLYNSNDGEIKITATGGSPGAYTYTWSNGNSSATASNLAANSYWYTVKDNNGCYDTDTVTLTQPDTILVNIGQDRKLCIGQTLRINGTATGTEEPLTYNWQSSNGFVANTAKASITDAGTYILSVTDTARKCTIRDTVTITRLDSAINTDFIVSTQAFKNEKIILVSLSAPYPHDSVRWMIPQLGNAVQIVNQSNRNCELLIADTGRYQLGLRVYYTNGCIDDTIKYVNVLTRDNFGSLGNQANAYLKLYALVIPNPNTGTFSVQLTFSEATRARMRLVNTLTNQVVDMRDVTIPDSNMHSEAYNLSSALVSGMYVLLIDTPKGSFVTKVAIVK